MKTTSGKILEIIHDIRTINLQAIYKAALTANRPNVLHIQFYSVSSDKEGDGCVLIILLKLGLDLKGYLDCWVEII